jgi:hypothetical protein
MDMEIEDLKDLVKKNFELTQETHRMVRRMQSAARWGRFFSIVWWLIIIAVSGVSYYYLQPYLQKAQEAYAQLGASGQQAQDYGKQISNFLQQYQQPH